MFVRIFPAVFAFWFLVSGFHQVGFAQSAEGGKSQTQQAVLKLEADVSRVKTELSNLIVKRAETQKKLQQLQDQRGEYLKKQDQLGVSSEAYPDIIKTLQSQRVQLIIDIAGLDARRDLLVRSMKKIDTEQNQELFAPLRKILELEQKSLDMIQQQVDAGTVHPTKAMEAERRLLLAQIRLVEARQESSGGSRVQQNLMDSALQHAEKQARLDRIETMLKNLTSARGDFEAPVQIEYSIASWETLLMEVKADLDMRYDELKSLEVALETAKKVAEAEKQDF